MKNDPTVSAAGQDTTAASSALVSGVRTAGVRSCPSCGATVSVHATICPDCGESLDSRSRKIRCRRCHHVASAELVVCPHCGRELQPAPSRWLTVGLPIFAVLLLVALLLLRATRGDPVSWSQRQVQRASTMITDLSRRLVPNVTIVTIPAGEEENNPLVSQIVRSAADPDAPAPLSSQPGAQPPPGGADAPLPPADGVGPGAVLQADNVNPGVPANTATAPAVVTEATATNQPTPATASTPLATDALTPAALSSTPRATTTLGAADTNSTTAASGEVALNLPTATSTASTAASATPTQAPGEKIKVRTGDTLFDIAAKYKMTVEELLAANNMSESDAFTIQPGDELLIPAPTPEGAPTATPTPVPNSYVVRTGDTIYEIAKRLNFSTDELLAANSMTLADARGLQPGDTLLVPVPTEQLPTATPTPAQTATPTPTPTAEVSLALPTATPAATASLRLAAPVQRIPLENGVVDCDATQYLVWQPVPSIKPDDVYVVHLGYLAGTAPNGAEDVTWVMEPTRPSTENQWKLDNSLCGLSPAAAGGQWRWYVEVSEKDANGALQVISPPSEIRRFTWK